MKAVFPGRPQAKLQAVDTTVWQGHHLLAYVSSNALVILTGPNALVQSISHDNDRELTAVAIDAVSGKIAVSSREEAHIYRPIGHEVGTLKWVLQDTFQPSCDDTYICSLSWGLPEELLIGGSSLTLLWTDDGLHEQWTKKLANRSKFCAFSHDASLIASTGWHDRLVKIWRRLFIGGGDERFDAAYLAHPATVTNIRWRGRPREEQHWDAFLYTVCADQQLRVWAASDPHCIQILDMWTSIDLVQCIQPENPLSPSPFKKRWVAMIDSCDFKAMIAQCLEYPSGSERELHARQHLQEVASQNPEVCIVLDERGNMSAWGIERIGCKARQERDVFNFANAQELSFGLPATGSSGLDYACLSVFINTESSTQLRFAVNSFGGSLQWLEASVDRFFDPSPQSGRLLNAATLTGHSEVIGSLTCSLDKQHFLSTGVANEAIVWRRGTGYEHRTFQRQSVVQLESPARSSTLHPTAKLAAFLHDTHMSVWDTRLDKGNSELSMCSTTLLCSNEAGQVELWSAERSNRNESTTLKPDLGSNPIMFGRPAITAASSTKLALADAKASSFSIWDIQEGWLEHQQKFLEHEVILQMCFEEKDSGSPTLAVSFAHRVLLYSAGPFDILKQTPCWTMTSQVSIAELTSLPIVDCQWLSEGDLVLAAGSQLFVHNASEEVESGVLTNGASTFEQQADEPVSQSKEMLSTRELPLYHPQMLALALYAGKNTSVSSILSSLHDKVKFWTEGEHLDPLLGFQADAALLSDENSTRKSAEDRDEESSPTHKEQAYSEDIATALVERLANVNLPLLRTDCSNDLIQLVKTTGSMQMHQGSVDSQGMRYLSSLELAASGARISNQMQWRDFVWASFSSSQDILINETSRKYGDKPRWQDARATGMFMWISDLDALRAQFEVIARNEYTSTEERNPIDCTLYYLALRKKQVLTRLWRMASWNREQGATLRMLNNNFDDPRWKTAALKNAYALMGKRRHEYAACFFLLAGNLKDAIGVLSNQLGDLQLAIAVARVYEGDSSPALQELLREKALPKAVETGDRWLAIWTLLLQKREDLVLRVLTEHPTHTVLNLPQPSMQTSSWRNEDPSLTTLYAYLRDRITAKPRHEFSVSPGAECALVMRAVRLYIRMGCSLLALDLVRNWRFTPQPNPLASSRDPETATSQAMGTQDGTADPEAAEPEQETRQTAAGDGMAGRRKVEEEPSTGSILDNFDF
ncbi:MAG: regulator of (H+)-ATPase in vacuolar membrane [Chrysothrix sp. TS-e1954]|nr:MAG: regulator of (H+)-ATPase in vacuolar membrane [Chrysothrix sp. TS-e1954]